VYEDDYPLSYGEHGLPAVWRRPFCAPERGRGLACFQIELLDQAGGLRDCQPWPRFPYDMFNYACGAMRLARHARISMNHIADACRLHHRHGDNIVGKDHIIKPLPQPNEEDGTTCFVAGSAVQGPVICESYTPRPLEPLGHPSRDPHARTRRGEECDSDQHQPTNAYPTLSNASGAPKPAPRGFLRSGRLTPPPSYLTFQEFGLRPDSPRAKSALPIPKESSMIGATTTTRSTGHLRMAGSASGGRRFCLWFDASPTGLCTAIIWQHPVRCAPMTRGPRTWRAFCVLQACPTLSGRSSPGTLAGHSPLR